jgi:ribosomal protein L32
MRCRQRDLLLVPVPFTDQTQTKLRPVVVLSNEFTSKSTRYSRQRERTNRTAHATWKTSVSGVSICPSAGPMIRAREYSSHA